MTLSNRQSFWIANLSQRRAATRPTSVSGARSAAGRPAKKTDGLVTADTNGTRSIPGVSAPPASTSGLRHSASHVPAGRRIRDVVCKKYAQARAQNDLDSVAVVCRDAVGILRDRPTAESIVNSIVTQAAGLLRRGGTLDLTSQS